MSELLLRLKPSQDAEDAADEQNLAAFSVQIEEKVMKKLQDNFANCPTIAPVLCVGNSFCGRSIVLDSIIKRNQKEDSGDNEEPENLSYFVSNGRQIGVYVWPTPVRLGEVNLLLLKMWGVDFRNLGNPHRALIDKVLSALLCITSVCIVCTEKGSLFPAVKTVQDLYGEVKRTLGLTISQFVGIAESENHLERLCRADGGQLLSSPERPITQFLYRGSRGISGSCAEQLCQLLQNPELHVPFLTSHQDLVMKLKTENLVNCLALMLQLLVQAENLDFSYRGFMSRIPRFASAEFEQQVQELYETEERVRHVLSGESLDLFTIEDFAYSFNLNTLESLHMNYDFQKPIIIMVLLGNQGIGKSTQLNEIIRVHTGRSQRLEFFKTGSGVEHTTRACQVFSQPLSLGGNQLMLIDIEGLRGAEIVDDRHGFRQDNLMSALLTVASVPCIFITDNDESLKLAEQEIKNIAKVQKDFGFRLDRVHLLLQDCDPRSGVLANQRLADFANAMNSYFADRQVVRIRSKPNFTEEDNAGTCEIFIRDILADSNFTKCIESGSFAKIQRLLVEMEYIMEHHSLSISKISFSEMELDQRSSIESQMKLQLQEMAESFVSPEDGTSLLTEFEGKYARFMKVIRSEQCKSENVWRHVEMIFNDEINRYRLELALTEYCYHALKPLSDEDLLTFVKDLLDYFYKGTMLINKFLKKCDELKKKLQNIQRRYPSERERMEKVLVAFEKKRSNLRNWYIAHYSVNIGLTALSGGLGLAAAGVSLEITAVRLGAGALSTWAAASSYFSINFSHRLYLTKTAIELYSLSSNVQISRHITSLLQEANGEPFFVLMLIGTKRAAPSILLNKFVHSMLPFTSSKMRAFNNSRLTQVLHFSYKRSDHATRSESSQALLIYLRTKKNPSKRTSLTLRLLAASLIPWVSLTCMFVQDPDLYAEQIIRDAFSQEERPRSPPTLMLVHRKKHRPSKLFTDLEEAQMPGLSVPIESFNEQGLMSALFVMLREFERTAAIHPRDLLEVLEKAEVSVNERMRGQ